MHKKAKFDKINQLYRITKYFTNFLKQNNGLVFSKLKDFKIELTIN